MQIFRQNEKVSKKKKQNKKAYNEKKITNIFDCIIKHKLEKRKNQRQEPLTERTSLRYR